MDNDMWYIQVKLDKIKILPQIKNRNNSQIKLDFLSEINMSNTNLTLMAKEINQ